MLLNIEFPKIYDNLPNDIENTSKIQAAFKDLGNFNVNITMGDKKKVNVMIDLGASINLMPYLLYFQLGLGELKPTIISL